MKYRDITHQQALLAASIENDFRAVNLAKLVQRRLIPGTVLDVGCGNGLMVYKLLTCRIGKRPEATVFRVSRS